MKHAINEWQDMGLKKDVEIISKEIQKNKSYEKPLVLELYIAIITLIVDKLFEYVTGAQCIQQIILWVLFISATIILVYTIFAYLKDYLQTRSNIKSSILNIKPFVDVFDNNICYYALTASNFFESLVLESKTTDHIEDDSELPKTGKDKCNFYYIETHYYINKCISEFSKIENIFKDIFTDDPKDVIYDSKIHYSRLINIIELLKNIRNNLYADPMSLLQTETNNIAYEYDKVMNKFISKINDSKKVDKTLCWIDLPSD